MSLGRDAVGWDQDVWDRLDRAVAEEIRRSGVAERLLPLRPALPDAVAVPADVIDGASMTVDETKLLALVETSVSFSLTAQQAAGEAQFGTAVTLATRAASLLSQAEDLLVFHGDRAGGLPVFGRVDLRGSVGPGLVAAAETQVDVPADGRGGEGWGERSAGAVGRGIAVLQAAGHHGPFALALHTEAYADAFAPLAGTLTTPADRIAPLVTHAFVGTGTVPAGVGVMLSVGGNVIDLVVGQDPVVAFTHVAGDGGHHFRAFERFALRIKDPSAIVRLAFAGAPDA